MRKLKGEPLTTIEEHLLICESCQDRLKATDEYLAALKQAAEELKREDDEREKDGE